VFTAMLYPFRLNVFTYFLWVQFYYFKAEVSKQSEYDKNTGFRAALKFIRMCHLTSWVPVWMLPLKHVSICPESRVLKIASCSTAVSRRINRLILCTSMCFCDEPNVRCVKPRIADVIGIYLWLPSSFLQGLNAYVNQHFKYSVF